MHNFTKFTVVVAVIGAGICAALPFRRLPPPSESTLAQNETPDQEPELFDSPATNTARQPAADRVELNMQGGTGQVDSAGIPDTERYGATDDEYPQVTKAPQIRARRQQEPEFADFADPAPPPALPSDFQRSFGSDPQPADNSYPPTADDERQADMRASDNENKKKTNAKKRGSGRKRWDNQGDTTSKTSSEELGPHESPDDAHTGDARFGAGADAGRWADDSVSPWRDYDGSSAAEDAATGSEKETPLTGRDDSEYRSTRTTRDQTKPFDEATAHEPDTGIPFDGTPRANETTPHPTAERGPWASDHETPSTDDRRDFAEEPDVAAREPTAFSSTEAEPLGRTEMGYHTRNEEPADPWAGRGFGTSTSTDNDFASTRTAQDAPRHNTAFEPASDELVKKADELPAARNPLRQAPPASMSVTSPSANEPSRAAAEPTPRIAKIERTASPQAPTGTDVRASTNSPRAETTQLPRRLPTTVARAPQFRQYVRHRVADGDSLASLAQRYLGNRNRYAEIFNANRHVLASPDILPIGIELVIPVASTSPFAPAASGGTTGATGGWQARPDTRTEQQLVPIPPGAFPRRSG
jgi:hypothetical protein